MRTLKHPVLMFGSVCIAAGIPLIVLGIAVTQGALGLGLLCFVVAGVIDSDVRHSFSSAMKSRAAFALAIMFAVWFVTVPFSNGVEESFTTALRTALYLLGCLWFWAIWDAHPSAQRIAMNTLIVLTIVMLVSIALMFQYERALWHPIRDELGSTEVASRYFKQFASILLCIVPVIVWQGWITQRWRRCLMWLMAPLSIYVFIFTDSRSALAGMIAMVMAVTLVLIVAGHGRSKWVFFSGAVASALGIAWLWFSRGGTPDVDSFFLPTWLIDGHRQIIWKTTFDMFLEAPWSGHGINRINYVIGADRFDPDMGVPVISSHPHNWMLEILAETGVFGFLATIGAMGVFVWRLVAQYLETHHAQVLTLIALSAGFFGSSLFNFSIWSSWWLLTYFSLFALIAAERPRS